VGLEEHVGPLPMRYRRHCVNVFSVVATFWAPGRRGPLGEAEAALRQPDVPDDAVAEPRGVAAAVVSVHTD
jgi:hypothetical protein